MWFNFKCVAVLVVCGGLFCAASEETVVKYESSCPIVMNATCPDSKYIKFHLFTRSNGNESQIIDLSADNLLETSFNPAHPTKILIHGFMDNITSTSHTSNVDLRTKYLTKGDYNLIAVDWSILGTGFTCYKSTIENAKHVGACIAHLVERLRTAPTEDIHVVGHSMGAHIAGFAAHNLKPYLLPRITGLDPAGPLFHTTSNEDQLDSSDARLVDILHTNIYFLGKATPCGHVDFYFNRDASYQPGCKVQSAALCSHLRSIDYFAESIISNTGFYGKQCASFKQFMYSAGLCPPSSRKVVMGEYMLTSSRGIVSVATKDNSPYAMGQ